MLNLSNILNALTEEQMDRVLEFKAGGKHSHGGCGSKSSKKSHSHCHSHSKKSHSKSCSWKSGLIK